MDNEIIKTPPTGKYTGVITDIQFLKKRRGTVIVTIAVYIRNKVEYYRKSYRNIFENGRSAFQDFCMNFGAFDDNYLLHTEDIPGYICSVHFDNDGDIIKIESESDIVLNSLDTDRIFKDIEINDFEPSALLKVYYCFPYNLNGYEDNFGYLGFIKDITVYPDKTDPTDETLRLHITVLNGGRMRTFSFYLNKVYSYGMEKLYELLDAFDIEYDGYSDLKKVLEKAKYGMSVVTLYTASTGNQYVSDIFPCEYDDQYEEEQHRIFLQAYCNYLKSNDPHEFAELA